MAEWLTRLVTDMKVAGSSLPTALIFFKKFFFSSLNAFSLVIFLFFIFFLWFYFSVSVLVFCFIFLHEFLCIAILKCNMPSSSRIKSSAYNDNSIIVIPNKNLPGKCCGQRKNNTI